MGQGIFPHMAGEKVENGKLRAHHPRPRATGVESERMFGKNVVKNSRAPAKCTNPILESALFLCNIPYCILEKDMVLYWCQGERPSRATARWVSCRLRRNSSRVFPLKKNSRNPLTNHPKCGTIRMSSRGEQKTTGS